MKQQLLFSAGCALALLATPAFGQKWVRTMQDPQANFYEVQRQFQREFREKEREKERYHEPGHKGEEVEEAGWEIFKRYENYMEPRVYPSGDRTLPSRAWEEYQRHRQQQPARGTAQRAAAAGNWTPMGPLTGIPAGGGGAGRVNFVRFHPTNPNTLYIGSPGGGLWISTNGGTSWSPRTDTLAVVGASDLTINYNNPDFMYLATGDGDASDTHSIGVLMSGDGGLTWEPTGLTWSVSQGRTIRKLLMHPANPDILFAAGSSGIYRTADGGATWTQVSNAGGMKDIEFKPGDPNTVYASSNRFYKSTDGGLTFTQVSAGVPGTVNRLEIAVTPDDPSYVYLLGGKSSDSGFAGLFRSTDSGTSFTTRSTTPNVLGWNSNGSGQGGQSWYDLAIAASPTDKDHVVVGGVNIWSSRNGGSSWQINGHWTGSGAPYVHADIHALEFYPGTGSTYFAGSDGGVFRCSNNGSTWVDISGNLCIGQMYKLGMSASNPSLVLTGWQDNGTSRYNGLSWSQVIGGDGMECFIDYSNDRFMYGELYNGAFQRSTNGGTSFTDIGQSINEQGAWVTPWMQDPVQPNILYGGFRSVWKSADRGTTWTKLGTILGTGTIRAMAVAPSNPQVMYVTRTAAIFKTTDGGQTWTSVTTGLPTGSAALTSVTVDPANASRVWVTFSGYASGDKVYYSSNGGSTWTNFSTGLPNLPVNCMVYQKGTADEMFVGTDVGVYYRNSSLGSWQPFSTGLPNVNVAELEIFYFGNGKLRAATYGRGLWETDLLTVPASPPLAAFSADNQYICSGNTVTFSDRSLGNPTAWSWSFPGGSPATSASQNPTVSYAVPGVYLVSLMVTNANGTDTLMKSGYINVGVPQALPLQEGFQGQVFTPSNWVLHNPDEDDTWGPASVGAFNLSTASAAFDNYNPNVIGSRDALWTPKFDFRNLTAATLTFDVAYSQYDNRYSDSLAVFVSTDCGSSFTQLYLKGGAMLATAPSQQNSAFVPNATQWRTETISLTPYVGQQRVLIAFENRSYWGQMLYLDNVNITATSTVAPVAAFSASTDTLCAGNSVRFTDLSGGVPSGWSWSFPGGSPATSTDQNPQVVYTTPGTYSVTLTVTNTNGTNTLTSANSITINASPTVTLAAMSPVCRQGGPVMLSGGSPAGGTYSGPGVTNGMFDPNVTGFGNKWITYTYYTADGCGGSAQNTIPVINCTGIAEDNFRNLQIFPNPTTGLLNLSFDALPGHPLEVRLVNVLGQTVLADLPGRFSGQYSRQLDLGALPNGLYLLQLRQGPYQTVQRVEVQR